MFAWPWPGIRRSCNSLTGWSARCFCSRAAASFAAGALAPSQCSGAGRSLGRARFRRLRAFRGRAARGGRGGAGTHAGRWRQARPSSAATSLTGGSCAGAPACSHARQVTVRDCGSQLASSSTESSTPQTTQRSARRRRRPASWPRRHSSHNEIGTPPDRPQAVCSHLGERRRRARRLPHQSPERGHANGIPATAQLPATRTR